MSGNKKAKNPPDVPGDSRKGEGANGHKNSQNPVDRLKADLYRRFGSGVVNSVIADHSFYVDVFGDEPPAGELASIYNLTEEGEAEILELAKGKRE